MNFTREDWRLFLKKGTLCQKAGVREGNLLRLVVKELTDNAVDVTEAAGGNIPPVALGLLGNGFFVQDFGPGMTREQVTSAFSVNRPLVSTKLLRLPTRGALGNGLRVVAGAAVSYGADLVVQSRGMRYSLSVLHDGTTAVLEEARTEAQGTRIEMVFPDGVVDASVLSWGAAACALGGKGLYRGLTSPEWYTAEDLLELLHAADGTVRDVAGLFEGNTGAKAGQVTEPWKGIPGKTLSLGECGDLLAAMRRNCKPFNPKRLPAIGLVDGLPGSYVHQHGSYSVDDAVIPFAVDVWSEVSDSARLTLLLNRTPVAGDSSTFHSKTEQSFYLCGLGGWLKVGRRPLSVVVNLTTPHIPLLSDGKSPDVTALWETGILPGAIEAAGKKAVRAARDEAPKTERVSMKEAILDALPEGIDAASGGGAYLYSQRQLYYSIRPLVIQRTGKEPGYGHFAAVLTEYEDGTDLPGLYRDNRGILCVPHGGGEIALGTRTVASFNRPPWTFHKILYSEKEGLLTILKAARWPERWDCALLTSKGYASRACKDLLDVLGEDGEPLQFFCIHDADAAGTMIYETLQEATATRGRRKVSIVNLGLEPDEALSMGLQSEPVENGGRKAVASYVSREWARWLQGNRVELNAMPTPLFLSWLDEKMQAHGEPKLIPPEQVIQDEYLNSLSGEVRKTVQARILRENNADEQVERGIEDALERSLDMNLREMVLDSLDNDPVTSWREPVRQAAASIAEDGC